MKANNDLFSVIHIVAEDALSVCIAQTILKKYKPNYILCPIHVTGGRTYILKRLAHYNSSAKHLLFFVLVDLDKERCAVDFIQHCFGSTSRKNKNLIFRVAEREVESWVLADREGFSRYFKVSEKRLLNHPDKIEDPKQYLVNVIRKHCKNKWYKQSIVPDKNSSAVVGPLYNPALIHFVQQEWDIDRAKIASFSLNRCILALSRK